MGETSNSVWDSLNESLSILSNTAIGLAQTTATPSGQTTSGAMNPPPGHFGPYPQAQVKPGQGTDNNVFGMLGSAFGIGASGMMILVAVLLFMFLRRR